MTKELRPTHQDVSCDVCGRTILKGERTQAFFSPGGERKTVCELCTGRARAEGWMDESAHSELGPDQRPEPRAGLISRLRRRVSEPEQTPSTPAAPEPARPASASNGSAHGNANSNGESPLPPVVRPQQVAFRAVRPAPRKDARHVRAVPTNALVKVERALELFNDTEHRRTISGIARSLGEPWVSANPLAESPSEVAVVVAWELSWYRYRIDLGDADTAVTLADKGYELSEIDEELRDWNAAATDDGRLTLEVRSGR